MEPFKTSLKIEFARNYIVPVYELIKCPNCATMNKGPFECSIVNLPDAKIRIKQNFTCEKCGGKYIAGGVISELKD